MFPGLFTVLFGRLLVRWDCYKYVSKEKKYVWLQCKFNLLEVYCTLE